MHLRAVVALIVVGLQTAVAQVKLSPEQIRQLPPPATGPVSFTKDIKPILEASCVSCHGRGKSRGGFKLDTRESFLEPGDSGPAVVLGKSEESYLVHLVAGTDPDLIMPEKGRRLTPEQVGLVRAWIDQGLPWDEGVTFAREAHRNLLPREVEPPDASGDVVHPIDRFVWAYFKKHGITPPEPVDDRLFARRAYLDVHGLLPTPEQLDAFLADQRPDKRQRLVRTLLADDAGYAQHWLTFWNDLLRNDYRGTGYIDGGREQITQWLYTALKENKPYDQFVRELINPGEKGPRGFTKGIVWRGVVNASQTPPVQAAQNISQVFLGVNLKCASCHDSFIDDWQLTDAYGMAAIYAEERLELVRCDKPLGTFAEAKFLFPKLGAIASDAPREERIARLAEIMVQPRNGRLPRTIVNRLWARFLGRGLVEPVDVMQNEAWLPDLLDWLAEDLAKHNYDLKHTIEQILTSRAYQLPAVNAPEDTVKNFVFQGPTVRRLTAEQFRDALGQLTDTWHDKPEGGLDSLLFEKGDAEPLPAPAYWIWSDAHAAEGVPPQKVYFRKTVELPARPDEALAIVNVDNTHRLWVNGREARRQNEIPWDQTSILDLRPYLVEGRNVFAVEAVNGGDSPNPAGLLFYARVRSKSPSGAAEAVHNFDFGSDASWVVSTNQVENWHKPEFSSENWSAAQVLGPPGMAPWNVGPQFAATVHGRSIYGAVRASLVPADALTLALGRPNREQVTSFRPYTATTIQMLELTNGETLARILRQGAEKLTAGERKGADVVEAIFKRALGRPPTHDEARLSIELLGSEPARDGVEDLLWAVAMLPEFQLIY